MSYGELCMIDASNYMVRSKHDVITVDKRTASINSVKSNLSGERELLSSSCGENGIKQPLFIIHYLDEGKKYRELYSDTARMVSAEAASEGVSLRFADFPGFDIEVCAEISSQPEDSFIRWGLTVDNRSGISIVDIVFPILVFNTNLGGTPGSESIIWPYGPGKLFSGLKEEHLQPDSLRRWKLFPETWAHFHYPGDITAQFLALYDSAAGVFMFCNDSAGFMKRIQPLYRDPGYHLGFSHIGDWPSEGKRKLEYEVLLSSFTGDWYAAADLYREWARQQPWASKRLTERTDIPEWLFDSPPPIIIRLQGLLDEGPVFPVQEFLPYSKLVPLLEPISEYLDSKLMPMIMSWEKQGPWVYPDCFPPAGGEDSLREFCRLAEERRWHIGSFCNGTRWVTKHLWNGHNGEEYFHTHEGAETVCRTSEGFLWEENWDRQWRESYTCCLGVEKTKTIAEDFIRTLVQYGLDCIQFLDQNNGCAAFPCFADDHGHPSVPGRWMLESMIELLNRMKTIAAEENKKSDGKRRIVFSVERPVNEFLLQYLQICDIRVVPPGHKFGMDEYDGFVPLYHYLYHEYILIQGGFGSAPEPYHLPIRNTYNIVIGEVPGAVLKGDGTFLNKDTANWARWYPGVGNNDDSLFNLRAGLKLRKEAAKEFLVLGRMTAPPAVRNVEKQQWRYGHKNNRIDAVFASSWQAQDGRNAVVLGNWTEKPQSAVVNDTRLGRNVAIIYSGEKVEKEEKTLNPDEILVLVPPLGFVVIEERK